MNIFQNNKLLFSFILNCFWIVLLFTVYNYEYVL